MERVTGFRKVFWLAAATLGLGCSLVTGSVPGAFKQQAVNDLNAFLPPSNTPFLPVRATPTARSTASPTALPSPDSPTFSILIVLTGTATPTLTVIIIPSVTPTIKATTYFSPTITKSKQPIVYPTATSLPRVEITMTATLTPSPTETETTQPADTPMATEDPRSPTPTETLSGSETATPTLTESPTPTITPTATPTPTVTKTLPPSATPTPGPTAAGCATFNFDWEAEVAVLINEARARNKKFALTLDARLTNSARAHSIDMVVNKFMSHTGSDGSTVQQREQRAGYYGRYWGEIIGGGTPTIAVNWWMNEPGHRDMVLGTHWPYVDYGVGYAYCAGQGWFTVDFGAP